MKLTFAVITLLSIQTVWAQPYTPDPEVVKEVNEQLWKPFKRSYEARNSDTFNDLHTDDVMRISTWSGISIGRVQITRSKRERKAHR